MAHDADPHAHPEAPQAPAYVSGTDLGTGASASAFLLGLALATAPLWVLLAPPLSYTPAPTARATPSAPGPAPESPLVAPAANLGNLVERELEGGIKLFVPERGVEGRLLAFITDAGRPVDKTTWFDFDRLTFDTGSATLGPASHDQLSAVASLLAAYPGVKLKIRGVHRQCRRPGPEPEALCGARLERRDGLGGPGGRAGPGLRRGVRRAIPGG